MLVHDTYHCIVSKVVYLGADLGADFGAILWIHSDIDIYSQGGVYLRAILGADFGAM